MLISVRPKKLRSHEKRCANWHHGLKLRKSKDVHRDSQGGGDMYSKTILCNTMNIPAFICQCSWNSKGSVPMWMECWNWHPTNPRERLGEHLQELEEVHTSAGDLMSRSSAGDVAGDHSMSTDIPFPGVGKHEKRKLVFSAVPEKGSFSHVDWSRAVPSLTESSLVTLQLMPIKSMSEESCDLTSRVLILRVLNNC